MEKVIPSLDPKQSVPELRFARFSHLKFSQLMAEYLIAQVISTERRFQMIREEGQLKSNWNKVDAKFYR